MLQKLYQNSEYLMKDSEEWATSYVNIGLPEIYVHPQPICFISP